MPFLSQTRVHLTCLERPFAAGQGSYWQHTRWGQALQRQHTFTFFPGRQRGKKCIQTFRFQMYNTYIDCFMGCGSNYDCFHTTAKCVFWILIRNAHFELKFERRYFLPCVRQITLRCIIWNAHFKWRSRGVFQLRISQITQRNHCMNALTSKSWFAEWPSNHFGLYTARCICT